MEKNEIINEITQAFEKKYFKNVRITSWWVNDETDTVFYINDFWLETKDMLFCICNNVSPKRFFEVYAKFEEQINSIPKSATYSKDSISKRITALEGFLKNS